MVRRKSERVWGGGDPWSGENLRGFEEVETHGQKRIRDVSRRWRPIVRRESERVWGGGDPWSGENLRAFEEGETHGQERM